MNFFVYTKGDRELMKYITLGKNFNKINEQSKNTFKKNKFIAAQNNNKKDLESYKGPFKKNFKNIFAQKCPKIIQLFDNLII